MNLSRRSLLAGLLASAAIGPALAQHINRVSGLQALTVDISGLAANLTYDVFVFNDGGELKLVTGPAWSEPHHRGTAEIEKLDGCWFSRDGKPYIGSVHVDNSRDGTFYHHHTRSVHKLRA